MFCECLFFCGSDRLIKWINGYFSRFEKILWLGSVTVTVGSYFVFEGSDVLTLTASLIGMTSLIFSAKGHFIGPLLAVVFALFYGYISYTFRYYGEMLTYLGMTGPMALLAFISWVRSPFKGNRSEVTVRKVGRNELLLMAGLSAAVTVVSMYLLKWLGTSNLIPSTFSVTTSFIAVYLTERRSPYFSLAYAFNDIVLIVLWLLAALEEIRYASVMICFAVFLVNDIYAFINWKHMEKRQLDIGKKEKI